MTVSATGVSASKNTNAARFGEMANPIEIWKLALWELNPPEAMRSYSSIKDFSDNYSPAGHHDSALDSRTGWTPARSDHKRPWVQMDAGQDLILGGVVVQSWYGWTDHGVSKVRVEVSLDSKTWTSVEDGRLWQTPYRRNQRNRCEFSSGVTCRFVRVVGVDYVERGCSHGASMRCGMLVGPLQHDVRREWLRAIHILSDVTSIPDTLRVDDRLLQLFQFFRIRPGLRRLIGGLISLYYSPFVSNHFYELHYSEHEHKTKSHKTR